MELIIMAILAGIVSWIGNQKKKGEEQERQQKPSSNQQSNSPVQQREPQQTAAEVQREPRKDRVKNAREAFDRRAKELASEYQRQRSDVEQAKPQRNQPRVEKIETPAADLTVSIEQGRPVRGSKQRKAAEKAAFPKVEELSLKNGLKENDLVNGIVMAEILGPPRSKKTHSQRQSR
ncbi:hypothetical protein [Jeotgalibacillus campisalis]|uniref:Uncharacterized protein n=1 Tax=Jeotgalibacillus campisalis TaxID=220754 RepID=A0A0C2R738_9BACL|nr:hypothetical protein [Jeotgalibacillus campisalis]KIL46040.1 hypothetical protein KR50_27150 [Jeotgalibacillus campisalis]